MIELRLPRWGMILDYPHGPYTQLQVSLSEKGRGRPDCMEEVSVTAKQGATLLALKMRRGHEPGN